MSLSRCRNSRAVQRGSAAVVALVSLGCLGVVLFGYASWWRSPQPEQRYITGPARHLTVAYDRRMVLAKNTSRLPLTVPANATLRVGFGVVAELWDSIDAIDVVVAFVSDGKRFELLRRRLNREVGKDWEEVDVSLDALASRSGELQLLSTEVVDRAPPRNDLVYWAVPTVRVARAEERPNIILVSIDTLRADHLGSYGYHRDTSPNLDRLARQGVLFRQTIAPSSWTLPSHASMLTGVHPARHGAVRFTARNHIAPAVATMPELLWRSGYATAGFTDGGFVSALFGFERGFERYNSGLIETIGEVAPGAGRETKNLFAENIVRAHDWIRSVQGQPFFLFLHTYAVHIPYKPPVPYDRMFDPSYDGPCRGELRADSIKRCLGEERTDPRMIRHLKALYDGEIRNMDNLFERFMAPLRAGDLGENTCVIVTSDHGEEFHEHGKFFHHRADLFDELIRIPLIVWCPSRFTGGRAVAQQVSLLDLAPTILELAGVTPPAEIDGVSLLPTLDGHRSPPSDAAVSEVDASVEKGEGVTVSVRTERYKLVASNIRAPMRLFDLHVDPGETEDLSTTEPEVVAELSQRLSTTSLAPEPAGPEPPPPPPATPDPAVMERLRALGYIE